MCHGIEKSQSCGTLTQLLGRSKDKMAETTMPATEAKNGAYTDEVTSYEFAFHILPTVAEGEVPETLSQIKAHITNQGGTIFDEESPERIDLVYPIVKHLEGKNRTFASSYFGWIRFRLEGEKVVLLEEELRGDGAILRFLLVKLTKVDEAHPFRFHEHRKSMKMVETVDEAAAPKGEVVADGEQIAPAEATVVDASLDKITQEGDNSEKSDTNEETKAA
jgi:ribosomal protein S6